MIRIAKFEFAEGARFQAGANTDDADVVGRRIDWLRRQQHGELTPQDVVDDARSPGSPIHSFFQWDDSLAAEAYRLSQARGLIRSVVAVYTSDEAPAKRMRAYVHVAEATVPHYRETMHALSQEKTREIVLRQAWQELQRWRTRYKELAEFAGLIKVADELEKTLPTSVRA